MAAYQSLVFTLNVVWQLPLVALLYQIRNSATHALRAISLSTHAQLAEILGRMRNFVALSRWLLVFQLKQFFGDLYKYPWLYKEEPNHKFIPLKICILIDFGSGNNFSIGTMGE
jgi:hypothetical protein